MLKIAEMEYNGANSIFLRLLLDKKYALPFRCWTLWSRISVVPHGQANAAGAMAPEPADASAALQSRPVLRTEGGAAGATEVSDVRKDFVRDPARAAKRRVA